MRIGGIYALERVARDSAKDQPTVMEVLTAFIREHSREPWPPPAADSSKQERLTRPDVQAAVTVVGRRNAERDILPIDLTGADLSHATLRGAHPTGANLRDAGWAMIRGREFTGALLGRAILRDADLTGADLIVADLTGADLGGAHLRDADLSSANLTGADLTTTDLTGADLGGAHLRDADLRRAILRDANLRDADLTGANLRDADFSRADLRGAMWPKRAQAPDGWMVDGDSGRLKRVGQLSEVMAHYLE